MSDDAVVSLAERPDLRERLPFGAGWPQFIFHDPVARRLIPDVDRFFAEFNLALLDHEDAVAAGGWGARVLAPVAEAMRIVGTVDEWEEWTGMALPESGSYVVPDALAPVSVDRERDEAVYVEPGVWMLHP